MVDSKRNKKDRGNIEKNNRVKMFEALTGLWLSFKTDLC